MNNHLRSREMRSDGTFDDGAKAVNFGVSEGGTYTWSVYTEDGSGFLAELYPVGIEVRSYSGAIVPTDTTKVRFHSGHEPPFKPEQIYYVYTDIGISESAADVILRNFEAIENGDLAAFRSTLKSPEDGADIYYQIALIYKYFGDFFDVDDAGLSYAIVNAEGLESIRDTTFSREFPLRNRNTGLFVKKMEMVTDRDFRNEGYNELIKVVVANNKNEEVIYHLDIVDSITYEGISCKRINKHLD